MERRSFLRTLGAGMGAYSVSSLFDSATLGRVEAATRSVATQSAVDVGQNETYWREIQQVFSVSRSMINLNNGYCCPSPRIVTEAVVDYIWQQEEAPA